MNDRRHQILEKILKERERQLNLVGSEFDVDNSPNDWVSIALSYLCEEIRRNGQTPTVESFEDSLTKAAALIVAALEYSEHMKDTGKLK